jgi:hypothetical protein
MSDAKQDVPLVCVDLNGFCTRAARDLALKGRVVPCLGTADGELYAPPPFPGDRWLRLAVFALEVLILDEGQPLELRRDARVLKYWLCYEHFDDSEKDWTWVVEHLAHGDKYVTHVIKTAMDVAPNPDGWYYLANVEIDDCWDDHMQGRDLPVEDRFLGRSREPRETV